MLWLVATLVLAVTPLAVFLLGGSDAATGGDRRAVAAVGVAIAWPLLVLTAYAATRSVTKGFARGTLLALYAGAVFAIAWRVADDEAFSGDGVWTAFWLATFALWVGLSLAAVRR
jgi:hypothetical protein